MEIKKRNFHMIYSISVNHGIGLENRIPWAIPEVTNWFNDITIFYHSQGWLADKGRTTGKKSKNAVIMGRKTFESILK